MIVIRIELWPHGDEKRKRILGSAVIINDGTGNATRGNYIVRMFGKRNQLWNETGVKNFPRRQRLVWDLLYRALKQVVGSRNDEK